MAAVVDQAKCDGCKTCEDNCPSDAIHVKVDKAEVDKDACIDCNICQDECPQQAISREE